MVVMLRQAGECHGGVELLCYEKALCDRCFRLDASHNSAHGRGSDATLIHNSIVVDDDVSMTTLNGAGLFGARRKADRTSPD